MWETFSDYSRGSRGAVRLYLIKETKVFSREAAYAFKSFPLFFTNKGKDRKVNFKIKGKDRKVNLKNKREGSKRKP